MNKDHYPFYGVALVAGAALAVWAGMPFAFLLFLVCPLMMFFMMKGMVACTATPPLRPRRHRRRFQPSRSVSDRPASSSRDWGLLALDHIPLGGMLET